MSEHLEEGLVLRKCCIFGAIIMFVVVITVGLALQNSGGMQTSQGLGRNKGRECTVPSQVGAWPRE